MSHPDDLLVRAPVVWTGPGTAIRDGAVATLGGEVEYVGPAAKAPEARRVLEVDGFVMPAIVDRHVHIGLSDPAAVLLGGVVAVRDLGWPADAIFSMADASELPTFNGPVIRAAGPMITGPGGYPTKESYCVPGYAHELGGPDDAVRVVRSLAARDAAAIKVALNAEAGPTPSDQELAAICATAGELGVPVTVHAQGRGQIERALGAGVAELAHAPFTERLPEGIIEALARTTRIVGTLATVANDHGTESLRTALDNLERFVAAGGALVYGTDMGPPEWGVAAGIHVPEALLMRGTGLDHEAVLASMVRGPLERETPADLIALAGDPLDELEALGEVRLVVRAGRVVRAG